MERTDYRAAPQKPTDLYAMALLLAEGQSRDGELKWDVFVDNLARITDSFAQSRVRPKVRPRKKTALVSV